MTPPVPPTPPAPSVRLCTALAIEARALGGRDVLVIGVRARHRDRLATLASAAAAGDTLALVGFGGGLRPGQRAGDIVVASEIRHAGGRAALPGAPAVLAKLHAAGIASSGGPIWCAPHLVHGRQRSTLAATGAVAVDMESATLVDACGADRLVVVRVIVDAPARGLVLGCLLGGRRAWRVLRNAGAALAGSENLAAAPRPANRPTRDDSITSGTVRSGDGTPGRAH